MKTRNTFAFVCLLTVGLFACEDEVVLDLPDAPPVLVIDAFINDIPGDQQIILTETQPYFSNTLPDPVTGAIVQVSSDNGGVFDFTDEDNDGVYTWSPTGAETIGTVGDQFELSVQFQGKAYRAFSQMNRVPEVDSVVFTFRDEDTPFQERGYYGEFVATDLVGPGDAYWIKAYKNDTLLNRPFELNLAVDAGFNLGGNIDGVVFIQPIQDGVNPLNDDLDQILPYLPGDSLYVEIHSITLETWEFLTQVAIQTQRDGGFDEIFAEPLENVSTNLQQISGPVEEEGINLVGFFSVSAVKGNGKRLVE